MAFTSDDFLNLLATDDLVYLATPYSKYPDGIDAAFTDACKLTAKLVKLGIKVYSPIAHTHPIAIHGGIDPYDHNVWMKFDLTMMEKSSRILIAMMDGWDKSLGIMYERGFFRGKGRKEIFVNPKTLKFWETPNFPEEPK